tara:strand:+ start:64 stop:447 length:384 start_codon:yes stop_codon:yes gene_type:complete
MLRGYETIRSDYDGLNDKLIDLTPLVMRYIKNSSHARPVKSYKIEEHFEIKGPAVRCIVHYLRKSEHPIGSDSRGYYYCKSEEELEVTIDHMRQREGSIREARIGLEHAFSGLSGNSSVQLSLGGIL